MGLPPTPNWDARLGRRLRLRDMHVLLTVAQAASMAGAAARLGVPQPAVSQAIADLEAAFGLRQGIRDIEFLADPGSGTVVIGASESYVAGGFLSAIIDRMARRHPRLSIQVIEANTAAQDFAELRERRVDLMLGRLSPNLDAEDLHFEPLFEEAIHLVAGAQNAWAQQPGLTLADVADKPWILAPEGTAVHAVVARAFMAAGLPVPRATVTTYSMQLRLQLLASGEYITAFPGSLLLHNAGRWALQALPMTLGQPLPVAIVALRNRTLSPSVQLFIDEARSVTHAMRG